MIFFSKRAVLAGALALGLFPLVASAQSGVGQQADNQQGNQAQGKQQRPMGPLAQRLNLTDDQKRQWMQIQRETGKKVRAARMDESLNEQQMQAQLRQIHKEQREALLALLTPEQQQELKNFWEEQKQKQQSNQSGDNTQSQDSDKTDDMFAGMISDDPPAQQPQSKRPPK